MPVVQLDGFEDPRIEPYPMKNDFWGPSNPKFLPLRGDVIHYSASRTMHGTIRYLLEDVDKDVNKSASYHFLFGDGRIIMLNDPRVTRAWHAGKSTLTMPSGRISSLNKCSVGLSIRNYGWSKTCDDPGDDGARTVYAQHNGEWLYWESYSLGDVNNMIAVMNLLEREGLYQNKLKEFIVGHEDIAMGRKVDPGPLFPWHHLWENLGYEY